MRSTYISMSIEPEDRVRAEWKPAYVTPLGAEFPPLSVPASINLAIGHLLALSIEEPSKAREIAAALLAAVDQAEGLSGGEQMAAPVRGEA